MNRLNLIPRAIKFQINCVNPVSFFFHCHRLFLKLFSLRKSKLIRNHSLIMKQSYLENYESIFLHTTLPPRMSSISMRTQVEIIHPI